MTTAGSRAHLYGAENLPSLGETVVYVPNHTSFMDILVLSGFIPRPFKYLSKADIIKIPIIGQAMQMALHVFLERDSIQSSFKVIEDTITHLRNGNSMVVFAEGSRSRSGKLQTFKKGAFQMAKKAGVRIVPVSLGNVHRWMPDSAVLPIGHMSHVYVKIHPPIDVTPESKISELRRQTFDAVNSGLPSFQQFEPVMY